MKINPSVMFIPNRVPLGPVEPIVYRTRHLRGSEVESKEQPDTEEQSSTGLPDFVIASMKEADMLDGSLEPYVVKDENLEIKLLSPEVESQLEDWQQGMEGVDKTTTTSAEDVQTDETAELASE